MKGVLKLIILNNIKPRVVKAHNNDLSWLE